MVGSLGDQVGVNAVVEMDAGLVGAHCRSGFELVPGDPKTNLEFLARLTQGPGHSD